MMKWIVKPRAVLALGAASISPIACSQSSSASPSSSDAGEHDVASAVDEPRLEGSVQDASSRDEPSSMIRDEDQGETGNGTTELFDGRDLSGWETYLGPPLGSQDPIGTGRDPNGVFSVVSMEGAPAIRLSGEDWGSLTTRQEFANYHLRAEYKWGTHAVWPPLSVRDSGLMYHSVGPFGAVKAGGGALADPPLSGYFMTSMEVQIAQGDVGSYASLGPITVDGGPYYIAASGQYENAVGSWNLVEVFTVGNEAVQLVNGHAVAHVKNAMLAQEDGGRVPLTKGKIQLESESMEIYFRSISLESIDRIPDGLAGLP
jgi:hypothetical protein